MVNFAGTSCDAACTVDSKQINSTGRCACAAHMSAKNEVCGCYNDGFEYSAASQDCLCKSSTYLTPNEKNCVAELEYAELSGNKYFCYETLKFEAEKCVPVESWTASHAACALYHERVVNLLGTDCVEKCADKIETPDTAINRCICGAHSSLVDSVCKCVDTSFEERSGDCACPTGKSMTPDEKKCVDALLYSTKDADKFSCKEGFDYISEKCALKSTTDW